MKIPRTAIVRLFEALFSSNARTGTVYLSPKFVIRASKMRLKRGKLDPNDFRVTMGRPNHSTRKQIKLLQKAGEPFPVRKVHLSFLKAK